MSASPTQSLPQDAHAVASDETAYVARNRSFNVRLYLTAAFFNTISGTFGDPSVLMTNLGTKIDAPGWVKVLPAVASMTLSYVTVILMGWWMKPEQPRRKLFFYTVGPTYATYFFLAGALWFDLAPPLLVNAMIITVLVWGFIDGFSMLPCWDLVARISPKNERASMMSMSSAVSYITMIVASAAAAWLISGASPLKFPHNYALCMTIYAIAGISGAAVMLNSREYIPPVKTQRQPPREYVRDLIAIPKTDKPFRDLLLVCLIGATLQTIAPVFLVYAQTNRNFGDADVSTLIAIRPWVYMAVSLGGVWLAKRLGNVRMAMFPVAFVGLAAIFAPILPGQWQLIAQLLGGLSGQIYVFLLLAIMHHAPPHLNTRYLTVNYVLAMLPGCFPLLMGQIVEKHPTLALGSITLLAAVTLALLLRLHRRYHDTAMEK